MAELATFFFEHIGAVAAVVIIGMLGDYFATAELKAAIAGWIKSKNSLDLSPRSVKRTLRFFLTGLIHRIFGKKQFSRQFFLRSSIVTIVFFLIAVLIQIRIYDGALTQLISVPESMFLTGLVLILVLIVNFFIDYISNVQTVSLLNMATSSGRVLDLIVVFFADLALTITLFTLLFPVGLVASILCVEALRPPVPILLEVADKSFSEQLPSWSVNPYIKSQEGLSISGIKIKSVKVNSDGDYAQIQTAVIHASGLADREIVATALATLSSNVPVAKLVEYKEGVAQGELKLGGAALTGQYMRHLYYSSFTVANITRDGFLNAIYLVPVVLDFNNIHRSLGLFLSDAGLWLVRCTSGKNLMVRVPEGLGDCKIEAAVAIGGRSDPLRSIRYIVAASDHFFITPLFFTSFTVSILFYSSIFIVGFGVFIARILGRVFSTSYLETTTKPFALLGFMLFAVIEVVVIVVKGLS